MPEDSHDNASDDAASSGCSSCVVQLFDQAVAEMTDEIMSKCHEGRAGLLACVRWRCARLVDQQLEAFRELAEQREQQAILRREERNEATRRVLGLMEQQHKEALEAATASAASAAMAEATVVAASKLEEVRSKARNTRLDALSVVMEKGDVRRSGASIHLIFLLWVAAKRSRSSIPSSRDSPFIKNDDKEAKGAIKPGLSVQNGSENEPPRNGMAISHPHGPPPAHMPRDRPALRSVRSDGSMTPARPGTVPSLEPTMPTVQPPSIGLLSHVQTASPSLVCRVETAKQHSLGENVGVNQRSTGSLPGLPPASGDVAWGAATRAPSTERQHSYRQASPTPRSRPPALASPGVPLAPPHLQQALAQQTPTATGYRPMHTSVSLPGTAQAQAQAQAQAAAFGSTAPRAVTPRSSPPSCPVQMMSAPAAAWQSSGAGVVASTPRGMSPFGDPPKQNSGSFVAAPPSHKPSTVHSFATGSCPQRAASGPTSSSGAATQPSLSQMSPPQNASQVARLRQGSPLSRSRTMEWNSQPSAQSAQAFVRPHAAWGHIS